MIEVIHWGALAFASILSFIYFRDLGDVVQAVLSVERAKMLFAIRHETAIIGAAGMLLGIALLLSFAFDAGNQFSFWLIAVNVFFLAFPWLWIHVGLRHQQFSARYVTASEAAARIRPDESVIVIEHNGHARAHADNQIWRPHLAGTPEGLGGENVIMTYCAMSHLGIGMRAEIDNEQLELEVIAQHGNNLLMRDKATGEPVQQMYGYRECGGNAMQRWPTWRMSFRGFQKAWPEGQVFVNVVPRFRDNPLLFIVDNLVEFIFRVALTAHHHSEALMFETMTHGDDRLPKKALVWGIVEDGQAAAFTDDVIRSAGMITTRVGTRDIVLSYDAATESVNAFYNDSGDAVLSVDCYGNSNTGLLPRVSNLFPGLYWFVWVNFYPQTSLNQGYVGSDEIAEPEQGSVPAPSMS